MWGSQEGEIGWLWLEPKSNITDSNFDDFLKLTDECVGLRPTGPLYLP